MKRFIVLLLLASSCSMLGAGCGCGKPKPKPKPKAVREVPAQKKNTEVAKPTKETPKKKAKKR